MCSSCCAYGPSIDVTLHYMWLMPRIVVGLGGFSAGGCSHTRPPVPSRHLLAVTPKPRCKLFMVENSPTCNAIGMSTDDGKHGAGVITVALFMTSCLSAKGTLAALASIYDSNLLTCAHVCVCTTLVIISQHPQPLRYHSKTIIINIST